MSKMEEFFERQRRKRHKEPLGVTNEVLLEEIKDLRKDRHLFEQAMVRKINTIMAALELRNPPNQKKEKQTKSRLHVVDHKGLGLWYNGDVVSFSTKGDYVCVFDKASGETVGSFFKPKSVNLYYGEEIQL